MALQHAWLFPGQGAQYVGMAADLVESLPAVARFYAAAEERTGLPLLRVCAEGPVEELKKTYLTQPAIYCHSVALALALREKGHRPLAVAGHSLGEYSALAAAGWIDPLDGAELVALRGRLMYDAGLEKPGTMAAVIGMEDDVIQKACRRAEEEAGVVRMANFNSPGQVVISGSIEGVDRALVLLKEAGGRILKKLVVSGAFHSPLMEGARQGLLEGLGRLNLQRGLAPVYCNVSGQACEDPGELKQLLERQLTEPVLWAQSMERLAGSGVQSALELGPGKVLKGLMRKIAKDVPVETLDKAGELEEWLGGAA